MTPSAKVDVDAVGEAVARRTPGEWSVNSDRFAVAEIAAADGDVICDAPTHDAHAIVAAINSIDALLSLAEAAVRYRDACEATHRFPYRDTLHGTATREYIDAIGARTRAHDALLSLIASRFTATERSGE